MEANPYPNVPVTGLDDRRPRRFTGRLVLGVSVLALGVVFLLDQLGVVDANKVLHFWPAVCIIAGLAKLVGGCSASSRTGGLILIGLGAVLLGDELGLFRFSIWHLWPLFLILIGAQIVFRALFGRGRPREGSGDSNSHVHAFAIMSGVERRLSTRDFRGGEATALMGGCEIDLRQCDITNSPAVFDVFAIWGGVELIVPGNWTVKNEGLALMGGFEDSRKETAGDPSKVLIVRGQVLMGGAEIRN